MIDITKYFDYQLGSKVWPSDDPEDSPFDIYTCKICEEKLSIQSVGTYYIGEPSFGALALKSLREHLLEHCDDEFLWKMMETNLIKANVAFDKLLIENIDKNRKIT